MKTILQSEANECSLACLAMVASAHGDNGDLGELRRRFSVSLKGSNLRQLIANAEELGFNARPVRVEVNELSQLKMPCILHWDMNHFVVLVAANSRNVTILDPAIGKRRLTLEEFSPHFTGIALELTPTSDFKPRSAPPRVALKSLTGRVLGLRRSLTQILMLACVLELFSLAAPMVNQLIVDDALASHDAELLSVLILGFGLLLFIQTLVALARSWMVMVLGQSLSFQWTSNMFGHLLKLPASFFERRHLGDIVSRFGSVSSIQRTLTLSVVEALLDGLMGLLALAMMLLYSTTLTAVVVGAVLAYACLRWLAFRPFREAAAERLIVAARENSHFLESLRAIVPLKLFGRERERHARWQNLLVDVQNRDIRTAKLNIMFSAANTFIFGIENLLVLWLGAGMAMREDARSAGVFTVGMLFAFVSYKTQFTSRVAALIDYGVEIKMLGLHSERLADIALAEPEKAERRRDLRHLQADIELRGVSFRYADGEPWVLKDVNLHISAGENVAIVGPSGGGKTTLLKVLLGLIQPVEGEVLYGGQPMQRIGVQNYRRLVGTVMQEDVLMAGSIADNVSFFDNQPNLARVQACARLAQVHDDIEKMPMAYETLVGDMGSSLSGGQKQRVLLARALYKCPRVLALDEATSHLDVANERLVSQSLGRLKLTRVVVAHRPETIAGAQRVVRLSEGRVVDLHSVNSRPTDLVALQGQ
ncbi:peptidase domain-containing ABC transporter [Albitalea terrae]|uniref:Cyclolysin secretion/processing ATP-binding protein CyaB n=2 Tax=Piscinibacter terrae TaxID=2496871 RepID=A0A3N7HRE2_9BURK|nr:peptidase domain-containing ABC transporter [Albitalea terrae]